ncbi:MAG: hypothetical protein PHR92_00525 [Lachnospiraceae bacterium]|nr:hypothetical protein [Lachnospiraceae bacterium]
MYQLEVKIRDKAVKAKKLRKNGIVPGSIGGGGLTETILIQMPEGDAKRLLKSKGKGGNLLLVCEDKKWNVLLKEVKRDIATQQIEDLVFQSLVETEQVGGTAKIILKNKDMVATMVQLLIEEIPYKALPSKLVETIEIDLGELKQGDKVKIEDLEIWKNPDVEVLMEPDNLVLNIVTDSKMKNHNVEESE